jgi:hypothetical protein
MTAVCVVPPGNVIDACVPWAKSTVMRRTPRVSDCALPRAHLIGDEKSTCAVRRVSGDQHDVVQISVILSWATACRWTERKPVFA